MIANGGCTATVRESALKVDSGRKSLTAPGTRTHVSIAPVFFSRLLYQLSYPHPFQASKQTDVVSIVRFGYFLSCFAKKKKEKKREKKEEVIIFDAGHVHLNDRVHSGLLPVGCNTLIIEATVCVSWCIAQCF